VQSLACLDRFNRVARAHSRREQRSHASRSQGSEVVLYRCLGLVWDAGTGDWGLRLGHGLVGSSSSRYLTVQYISQTAVDGRQTGRRKP
jgi:hypothetical protein